MKRNHNRRGRWWGKRALVALRRAVCGDFTVRNTYGATHIYFHPAKFWPDEDAVAELLGDLTLTGECSGGDLSRLAYGEVVIYFNPVYNSKHRREAAVEEMKAAIREDA